MVNIQVTNHFQLVNTLISSSLVQLVTLVDWEGLVINLDYSNYKSPSPSSLSGPGCVLHEGHREDVSVSLSGSDHSVSGHPLSHGD